MRAFIPHALFGVLFGLTYDFVGLGIFAACFASILFSLAQALENTHG